MKSKDRSLVINKPSGKHIWETYKIANGTLPHATIPKREMKFFLLLLILISPIWTASMQGAWNDSDIFIESVFRQTEAPQSFADPLTPVAFRASVRNSFLNQVQSLALPSSSSFSWNPVMTFERIGAHHVFSQGASSFSSLSQLFATGQYRWKISGSNSDGLVEPSHRSPSFTGIGIRPQILNGFWHNGRLHLLASDPQFTIAKWSAAPAGSRIEFELWRQGGAGGTSMGSNSTSVRWMPQPDGAVFSAYLSYRVPLSQTQVKTSIGTDFNSRFGRASTLYFEIQMYESNGDLEIALQPPTAVSKGAKWKIDDGENRASDEIVNSVPTGTRRITFKKVKGYVTPEPKLIEVTSNSRLRLEVTYAVVPVPTVTSGPGSFLQMEGDFLQMNVDANANGGDLNFLWSRRGKKVNGAEGNRLELQSVNQRDAGVYRVTVNSDTGSAPTVEGNVGVLGSVLGGGSGLLYEGAQLLLKQSAAGPGLSYRWLFDGVPLQNNPVGGISGADSPNLRIKDIKPSAAGRYQCEVRMSQAGSGEYLLKMGHERVIAVLPRPVVSNQDLGAWLVSGLVTAKFSASASPTRFEIAGLPRGVGYLKSTGQLTGRPLTAGHGLIKVRAFNAAGPGEWKYFAVKVEGLPIGTNGLFHGVVQRGGLNRGLGGLIIFKTTQSGAYSGRLLFAGTVHQIRGRLDHEWKDENRREVTVNWAGNQKVTHLKMRLFLQWDGDQKKMLGWVTVGDQPQVQIESLSSNWNLRANPATAYSATYTVAIEGEEEIGETGEVPFDVDPVVSAPEGMGFLQMRISASGLVILNGKMADGSSWTDSVRISDNGHIALHRMFHRNTASAQGWLGISRPKSDGLLEVDGTMNWKKLPAAIKGNNYPLGFPLHSLVVRGGVYESVQQGQRVLNIQGEPTPNASLQLTGLPTSFIKRTLFDFELDAKNRMVNPSSTDNPGGFRLTKVDRRSGRFEGGFIDNGAIKFYGLLVPRLAQGVGFFLIPERDNATQRLLSGGVILRGVNSN